METVTTALKALAHTERLRILALLSRGELTVSELTQVLELSQPRITQYVQTLEAAGIVERLREGAWVFSRLRRGQEGLAALVASALAAIPADDAQVAADAARLDAVLADRAEEAARFFADVANDRGQLGDEYLPRGDIEAAMRDLVGTGPYRNLVDLGTGTARVLTLLADRVERGTGLDNSHDMLRVARHRLGAEGLEHLDVRAGDIHAAPMEAGSADLVTLHQVLHYLDDPSLAVAEAARLLMPGGALLVVDFAAHDREEFRELYSHRRLGVAEADIRADVARAGLALADTRTVRAGDRPDVRLWLARKPVPSPTALEATA